MRGEVHLISKIASSSQFLDSDIGFIGLNIRTLDLIYEDCD